MGTKERRITGIDGKTIRLDKPLEREHYGTGEFRSEVANLSRNVIVESADHAGVHGHTPYHAYSQGGISYARFAHLGTERRLGRYAIHFHLVGEIDVRTILSVEALGQLGAAVKSHLIDATRPVCFRFGVAPFGWYITVGAGK